MKTLTVENELTNEQKAWIIVNSEGKSKQTVAAEFALKFKKKISMTLARRIYNRSKEPVVLDRPFGSPLTVQDREWILSNYKSGQKEFGFAYMAKKFNVPKLRIESLIRSNEQFKSKALDTSKYVMSFGKYKGNTLPEIPTSYLQWVLSTVNLSEWAHANIECEVENRLAAAKGQSKPSSVESSTHYLWTHPDGDVTYEIPNDVSMVGTENELPPF